MAADAFLAVTAASGETTPTRSTEMVVVVDLDAYRRGHTHDGEPCHIIGAGPIPVSVARELERDAFLKAVLHDGVNVQTVAHFGRHRPAHLETKCKPHHWDKTERDRRAGLLGPRARRARAP